MQCLELNSPHAGRAVLKPICFTSVEGLEACLSMCVCVLRVKDRVSVLVPFMKEGEDF